MATSHKYFLIAGLSGLLLALSYPGWDFDLGFLAWFGLIPFFWSFSRVVSEHDRARKLHVFFIGFAAGLVYFLIIFRWFWSIYPLDTLGIESRLVSFIGVLLIYLISSTGMALFWGLFGLVTGNWLLATGKSKPYRLLTIPALFVLLEYARSWGFGFLWAGSSSLFGPHWTLGNLAYSLANNSLALKLTSLVGIYGVMFVIVLINCLAFIILKNGSQTFSTSPRITLGIKMTLVVLMLVTLNFLGPKLIKPQTIEQGGGNAKKINFAVIQTTQPTKSIYTSKEILSGLEEQLKLLARVAKESPESQLIVFPETSELLKNISLFMTSAQAKEYFNNLFEEPKLIIAGGRVFDANGRAYSRVFDLDTQNDIINYYDKQLLTPGGEFLPYPIKLIAWLFSKTTTTEYDSLREFNVGAKDVSTVNFREQFKAAPMICSELLSPGLTKQTSQNSDVLISMASYGIFHGNPVIARQMLAATRFRAAETAKPVITSANMGLSYMIDSQGNIAYLAQNQTPQILTGSVVLDPRETWYNKVGDLPIILVSLLLIISLIFLTWFSGIRRP
ncbi:MAG: apolipoprotein N-acyltransferase [Candidatus Yanofskybacteria bacterium]|nr:apolipoprotein N-acyltransferase [Candidatus Yanofskybacteria bacterium]